MSDHQILAKRKQYYSDANAVLGTIKPVIKDSMNAKNKN